MRILGTLIFLLSCTRPNPLYCDAKDGCEGGLVCDLSQRTCRSPGEDASIEPDAFGCTLDDECETGVCTATGACEDAARIVYASATGLSAGACSAAAPCEPYYAVGQLSPQRPTMRLANGSYLLPSRLLIESPLARVAIVGGRSAELTLSGNGTAVVVSGAQLELRGMTLTRGVECVSGSLIVERVAFTNATGPAAAWVRGVSCSVEIRNTELHAASGSAVEANNGTLSISDSIIEGSALYGVKSNAVSTVIERSTITRNRQIGVEVTGTGKVRVDRTTLSHNLGGGLLALVGYDITNNMVYDNGDAPSAQFGGIRAESTDVGNRLVHNTVSRNDCNVSFTPPFAGGVHCSGGVAANNIIVGNYRDTYDQPFANINGNCDFSSSITALGVDVAFVRPNSEPVDLHIRPDLGAAENAGVSTNVTEDFDGQPRSDGMPDVGADELP